MVVAAIVVAVDGDFLDIMLVIVLVLVMLLLVLLLLNL
jgi:hypothetical protein